MSEPRTKLTRRQLLGGFLTIGAAGAAAGAGTMAYFSDTESSSGNTVQAGTLDLTLDGTSQTVTFLDESAIAPGDSGSGSVTLGNAGTVTGVPEVEVTEVTSKENSLEGEENGQDDFQDGELYDYLQLRVLYDGQVVIDWFTADQISVGDTYTLPTTIAGGGSKPFSVKWRLPSGTGNDAQSDSFSFDVTFRLTQDGA